VIACKRQSWPDSLLQVLETPGPPGQLFAGLRQWPP
jgi:hypothetical protein